MLNAPPVNLLSSMQLTTDRAINRLGAQSRVQRMSAGLGLEAVPNGEASVIAGARMNASERGLSLAARDVNDGLSLAQTADAALGEMSVLVQHLSELAKTSASPTSSSGNRADLQTEVVLLKANLNSLATTTAYNGTKLLDGSFTSATFQIDRATGQSVTIGSIANMQLAGANGATLASVDISTQAGAVLAVEQTDAAFMQIGAAMSVVGSFQNSLLNSLADARVMSQKGSPARTLAMDANVAAETALQARAQILGQAGSAMLAQANSAPQVVLSMLR